ncbi:crinkler (CRN) family protein [Rhizophagus irregularis DAOM 181602=DAOM 197198]|nr:crinkler (CRN) family protein [Rhizophagus irregularis DAOM 181602=DAOM 197198]
MYSENTYSTYRNTMIASVNCLILGEASDNNFNVVVGEVYTNDDKIDVAFDQFTVSNFKELLYRRKKVKRVVQDPDIPAIVAPATDLERKRKAVQDVGGEVLRKLIKRTRLTIPEIGSLSELLDGELSEDIKIPISQNEIDLLQSKNVTVLCSLDDLRVLFRMMEPNIPLLDYGTIALETFWNISFPTVGEEKSPTSTEDPKSELGRKFLWTYDPAPYVLGYYTHGPQVTFVAICRPVGGYAIPDVVDIVQSNLKFRSERVRHLLRIINLSCIINALQPVIGRRGIPEFKPVYRNDRMIEIRGTGVKKTYLFGNIQTRVQKLVNLYEKLVRKEVPNIDHLDCYKKESGSVHLSPKGLQVVPNNQQELFEAIICVLEALVVLHDDNDIYHRDIRWDNIIRRYDDPSKWFLIDWDDATEYPNSTAMHLTTEEHAPEVFTRNHRGEVIKNASTWITNLSEKITEFGDLLLSQDSTKRPSAKKALKKFKKIKKKILEEQVR